MGRISAALCVGCQEVVKSTFRLPREYVSSRKAGSCCFAPYSACEATDFFGNPASKLRMSGPRETMPLCRFGGSVKENEERMLGVKVTTPFTT